jgi:hypothetical protein
VWILIGFIVVVITILSIEGQLKKGYKQNEEIIKLLKEIKKRLINFFNKRAL